MSCQSWKYLIQIILDRRIPQCYLHWLLLQTSPCAKLFRQELHYLHIILQCSHEVLLIVKVAKAFHLPAAGKIKKRTQESTNEVYNFMIFIKAIEPEELLIIQEMFATVQRTLTQNSYLPAAFYRTDDLNLG